MERLSIFELSKKLSILLSAYSNCSIVMRVKPILLFFLLIVTACNFNRSSKNINNVNDSLDILNADSLSIDTLVQYSERELRSFLDSIGQMPADVFKPFVAFSADSIFYLQYNVQKELSKEDFKQLQQAAKLNKMNTATATRIFGKDQLDSALFETDIIDVQFYFFNKKDEWNEFALTLGDSTGKWNTNVYFFKNNTFIAKHFVSHHYGLDLEHFKDSDGKTVVYYRQNFVSGTGIWWFNFNFFKYEGATLKPALNILQNSNQQAPWSNRVFWFDATIEKTNPLSFKFVYNQEFFDTTISPKFINDSTIVSYAWNDSLKIFEGDFSKARISNDQILSYYVTENELLFINTYYRTLRSNLSKADLKAPTLNYLNAIKNKCKTVE